MNLESNSFEVWQREVAGRNENLKAGMFAEACQNEGE